VGTMIWRTDRSVTRSGWKFCAAADQIVLITPDNGELLNLGEVRAFDKDGNELVAKTAELNAHPRYPASKCIDGNPSTFCHSNEDRSDNTLKVFYASEPKVARIEVANRHNCCEDRIQGGWITLAGNNRTVMKTKFFTTKSTYTFYRDYVTTDLFTWPGNEWELLVGSWGECRNAAQAMGVPYASEGVRGLGVCFSTGGADGEEEKIYYGDACSVDRDSCGSHLFVLKRSDGSGRRRADENPTIRRLQGDKEAHTFGPDVHVEAGQTMPIRAAMIKDILASSGVLSGLEGSDLDFDLAAHFQVSEEVSELP